MSQHSGSLNPLSEHPASPALLTSIGPHRHLCSDLQISGPKRGTFVAMHPVACPKEGTRSQTHPSLVCGSKMMVSPNRVEAARVLPNTLRSPGRTALRQTPGVVKKHAFSSWVCHAHSQFEDRLRRRVSPELPLMRCFTRRNHQADGCT